MTYHFTLVYPKTCQPASVRNILKQLLIPRKWQHILRTEEKVTVNGHYRYFNQLVHPNEQVEFQIDFVKSQQGYQPSGKNPKVIYEDQNVLVIDKPKGQKTHPNLFETNTALNDCATYLDQTPYIVHRLDMLTGGLLLVAKNPVVVPLLNRQLSQKIFHREYLAQVNLMKKIPAHGTINFPIGKDPQDQRKRMVVSDGLRAVTHYSIIKQDQQTALLKISLETGRTHQIRVHLAAIGCPIIGDPLYNPNFLPGQELQLTAYKLSFIKPFSFTRQNVSLI